MAHKTEDWYVAVDPFRGLALGLVERSFLDYVESRFPEIVTPDPPYGMFVAHIDGRRVRRIPSQWAQTKRRLTALTNH